MEIKLTKGVIAPRCLQLSEDGEWITNRAWAVRRTALKDGHLLTTADALSLAYGEKLVDRTSCRVHEQIASALRRRGEWVRFCRTNWLLDAGRIGALRAYVAPDGLLSMVQERYALAFAPGCLYGTPYTTFRGEPVAWNRGELFSLEAEDAVAVVMPVNPSIPEGCLRAIGAALVPPTETPKETP